MTAKTIWRIYTGMVVPLSLLAACDGGNTPPHTSSYRGTTGILEEDSRKGLKSSDGSIAFRIVRDFYRRRQSGRGAVAVYYAPFHMRRIRPAGRGPSRAVAVAAQITINHPVRLAAAPAGGGERT